MKKKEILDHMVQDCNGYLKVQLAVEKGISRTYIYNYIDENKMEKAARGLYLHKDAWNDELFTLQSVYKKIIFSGETALYLHGLTDREPFNITATVKRDYGGTKRLKKKGVRLYYVSQDIFLMGVAEVTTNFGNVVHAYDQDRCLCDTIIHKKDLEIQTFETAMKEYMSSKEKNLRRLMKYANRLGIEDKVRKYTEVML